MLAMRHLGTSCKNRFGGFHDWQRKQHVLPHILPPIVSTGRWPRHYLATRNNHPRKLLIASLVRVNKELKDGSLDRIRYQNLRLDSSQVQSSMHGVVHMHAPDATVNNITGVADLNIPQSGSRSS